jgi:hypothetical protein
MKKIVILGIVFLFVGLGFQPAYANDKSISLSKIEQQPRGKTFIKAFGGNGMEEGYYVQQTTDGGYIILGDNYNIVWLIKTDDNGDIIWDKTYEGDWSTYCRCVQQTTDGGYVITGKTEPFGGDSNVWLFKTDSTGNIVWNKTFGGTDDDYSYSVRQTTDGGYILVGGTKSYGVGEIDVWLIKTDTNGNMIWYKTFGGADYDWGNCIQQTTDGGYIIVGATESFGSPARDVYLIKTNSAGKLIWEKNFGGTGTEIGNYVQQTTDGGYIITGFTWSYGNTYYDVWLIKTDSSGNKVWDRTYGRSQWDTGNCVQQTTDGGYIITGETYFSPFTYFPDVWLIKTNKIGIKMWSREFGGYGDSWGNCVQQTTDGGYVIVGFTQFYEANGDIYFIKTDESGRSRNKSLNKNMYLQRLIDRFIFNWRNDKFNHGMDYYE